jgi:hypothetical protein
MQEVDEMRRVTIAGLLMFMIACWGIVAVLVFGL